MCSTNLEDLLLDDVGDDVRDGGVGRAHGHHVQLGDLEAAVVVVSGEQGEGGGVSECGGERGGEGKRGGGNVKRVDGLI